MAENVSFLGVDPNDEQVKTENRLFIMSKVLLAINLIIAIVLFIIGTRGIDSYNAESAWMFIGISIVITFSSLLLHFFLMTIGEISISLKKLNINR